MAPRLTLLAALDAALAGGSDPERHAAGLAAAIRLSDLLGRHRLVWNDVMTPDSRLAKLCGRLGSAYPGEQAAAYDHATRLIRERRSSWSEMVCLPKALRDAAAPAPGEHAQELPTRPQDAGTPPSGLPAGLSAPDGDWPTTLARLLARAAWRTEAEKQLLQRMQRRLDQGLPIAEDDALQVRDIWWDAELDRAYDDELWTQELGS